MKITPGVVLAVAVVLSGQLAWASVIVTHEDFEGGADGWSDNRTHTSEKDNPIFTEFLGVFYGPDEANTAVTKSFSLTGTQTGVTIELDFYEIDSWDDETFRVIADGVVLFSHDFHQLRFDEPAGAVPYPGQGPPTTNLGFSSGWNDQTYALAFDHPTTATVLDLRIEFLLNSGPVDEAGGIDNLLIMEIPEPGSLAVMVFAVLGISRRRGWL